MYRILETSRYGGNQVRMGYGGVISAPDDKKPAPLDPIDPTTVGRLPIQAIMKDLKKLVFLSLIALVGVVTEAQFPLWLEDIGPPPRAPIIGDKYADHMSALEAAGIVLPMKRAHGRFWSGYFSVEKGRDLSRAIFNGKRLSARCPRPPPVNLMSSHGFLERLRIQLSLCKKCYVIEGDLRHWFHQVPLSERLSRFFALRQGNKDYRWRTLPMGWSWSPAVAQALTWFLLARRTPEQTPIFNEEPLVQGERLPYWLDYRGETPGFGVVYYDNFFIVVGSEGDALRVRKRLLDNAKQMNIEVKGEIKLHKDVDVRERGVDYLGMHIKWTDTHMTVRPTKIAEWRGLPVIDKKEPLTCRVAASYLGRALFAQMISSDNLLASAEGRRIVRAAQVIGRLVHRGGWEAELAVSALPELLSIWTQTLALEARPHQWSRTRSKPEGEVVLATDASSKGWGWVLFRRMEGGALAIECTDCGTWSAEDKRHIYLLERGLSAIKGLRPSFQHCRLTLVVDNVAVAWTLRQGFSRNTMAMRMMEGQDFPNGVWRVLTVVSQDNPADSPSRGEAVEPKRVSAMTRAITAEDEGYSWASVPMSKWTRSDWDRALVHAAPLDDDEEHLDSSGTDWW